ncbi:MAG: hypothetical protein LBC63_01320, partial [Holophagales bacterium]|nr:hypothetical protein [Holophagales bacterium]
PDTVSLDKIPPCPSRCGCPTTSAMLDGRILSAKGIASVFVAFIVFVKPIVDSRRTASAHL